MSADRLVSTYLNDHFAGSVAAVELARRAGRSNRGTAYGEMLSALVDEVIEDRATLQQVMRSLGFGIDRPKAALAWVAEKLGRFKLNGQVVGYSPLSRLEELEVLSLGIEGKVMLWQSLERAAPTVPALGQVDFERLIRRARNQLRRVRRARL